MGYIFRDVMIAVTLTTGVGDEAIQSFVCECDRLKSSSSQIIEEDNHLSVKDGCFNINLACCTDADRESCVLTLAQLE